MKLTFLFCITTHSVLSVPLVAQLSSPRKESNNGGFTSPVSRRNHRSLSLARDATFESPARSLFKDGTSSSASAESAAALLASASAPDDAGDEATGAGQRFAEKQAIANKAAATADEKELSTIRRRGSGLSGSGAGILKSSKYANEEDRHW
jgi:hypothetical protein